MRIVTVTEPIAVDEVRELAKELYHDMVKGVVDVEKGIIALGGEWHMDANNELIRSGSRQENIWGFNIYIYPKRKGEEAIEYVSLINIRPSQGNRDMEIKDVKVQNVVLAIIKKLIPELFV